MALSQWDMKYLNPEEQAQVLDYQKQWQGADANTRVSLNNAHRNKETHGIQEG